MSIYRGCSRVFLAMSFALLAFLAGCGGTGDEVGNGSAGNGSGGNSGPPPDTTVPTVTAMTPGEDSFGLAINSKLTATLSEAMDPALINTANFRLAEGDNAIPGTVSYDSTNHIAVFTPTSSFAPNTRFTATIVTGIKDLGNNPLTTDFAWCFSTGGSADSTPPSVISKIPASAGTGVAVNRRITATFSEEMNSSTLTAASFAVTGPGPTPVSGTVTYSGRTAVFTPSPSLAPNTTYTATIGTGATDLAGNALQANTWSFTTGASADVTAPVALSTSPAGSGVPIGSTINVTLNEPMDPATLSTANFAVTGPGATLVIGTVAFAFDATHTTATFTRIKHLTTPVDFHPTPVSNLEPNTTYTATLTTGAKDMAGNALAGNVVWSFTTAP